ncbi:MAG: hypothetical protein DHS20C17_12040 [Cyclobacteriaceae bacterium]|nr:MAG: hypothetical protein DHS20C17_12040 [Cyclobacteriaceae bacterium]
MIRDPYLGILNLEIFSQFDLNYPMAHALVPQRFFQINYLITNVLRLFLPDKGSKDIKSGTEIADSCPNQNPKL